MVAHRLFAQFKSKKAEAAGAWIPWGKRDDWDVPKLAKVLNITGFTWWLQHLADLGGASYYFFFFAALITP